MDTQSLLSLIDTFYTPGFDLRAAIARFGDGSPPEELRPNQMKLSSGDPEIAIPWIETLDAVAPETEPFLAGLVLELAEPAAIDFAALEERFGPSREMPRLKPDQLRPFQVMVKGLPLEGYVVLDVVKGDEDKAVRGVKRVILRRFPPPQKAA